MVAPMQSYEDLWCDIEVDPVTSRWILHLTYVVAQSEDKHWISHLLACHEGWSADYAVTKDCTYTCKTVIGLTWWIDFQPIHLAFCVWINCKSWLVGHTDREESADRIGSFIDTIHMIGRVYEQCGSTYGEVRHRKTCWLVLLSDVPLGEICSDSSQANEFFHGTMEEVVFRMALEGRDPQTHTVLELDQC